MGVIAEEVVRIKADTGTFKQDVDQAGGGVSKLGAAAGIAAVGGIALLGKGLMDGVKAAIEHEKAMAQTEAVIKSTHGAAGVTAKGVIDLADKIEKMSGQDDLAVQAGQNLLLHFGNLKNGVGATNQIFDRTTLAVADMAAATGKEFPAAAKLLGTALNDPEKGLTKLAKAGVTFTDAQKASIKTMVEHGNTAGAQKIILGELETKFGGAAKAAGGTFSGQVEILKAHLEDLEQSIGQKVLPILLKMAAWIIANFPKVAAVAQAAVDLIADAWNNGLGAAFKTGIAIIKGVIGAISDLIGWLKQNRDIAISIGIAIGVMAGAFALWQTYLLAVRVATAAYTAVQWLLNAAMAAFPVVLIVLAIAAVIAGLVLLYQRSETVRDIVDTAFGVMKTAVSTAVAVIVPLVEKIADVISTVISTVSGLISGNWTTIWAVLSTVVSTAVGVVSGYINGVIDIVRGVFALVDALIHGEWGAAWNALVSIFSGILATWNALLMGIPGMILGVFTDALGVITGALGGWAAAALALGTAIITGITGALANLVTTVAGFITGAVGAVTSGVTGAASAALSFGQGILNGIIGALGTLATQVGGFLSATATAITGAVAGVIAVARTFGVGVVTGVAGGLADLATRVGGFLSAAAQAITNAVAGVTNVARSFGLAIVTGAVDGVGEFATRVMGVVGKITGEIASFATNIFNGAKHVGDRIVDGVVSGLGNFVSRAMDVVNNLTGAIAGFAGNLYNSGRELAFRLADGIISGLGGLLGRLTGALQGAFSGAVGAVRDNIPGLSPIDHAGAHGLGIPLAEGVIAGFGEGIAQLRPFMQDAMSTAIRDVRVGGISGGGAGVAGGGGTVSLNDAAIVDKLSQILDALTSARGGGAPVTVVATGGASAAVYSARR